MSHDNSSRKNVIVRVAVALVAMIASMVFVGGLVVALCVAIGLGWWLGASAPEAAVAEASLGGVLVAEVHEAPETVWREPVRRETRIGRSIPAAVVTPVAAPEVAAVVEAPAPAPVKAAPVAVATSTADERPAVAEVPADVPSLEEQMRALRSRMSSGELETVEGERGRVSVGG